MSESAEAREAPALVLRVSVPVAGAYRAVATELAAKIAGFLGGSASAATEAGAMVERLAATVTPPASGDTDHNITFEFRQTSGELVIEARCADRASEGRHRLSS